MNRPVTDILTAGLSAVLFGGAGLLALYICRHPSLGNWFPLFLSVIGALIGLILSPRLHRLRFIRREIHRLKRAEIKLRKREHYLKTIFQASPVGIAVLIQRHFVDVNDRICAMTGYSREELLDKSSLSLYPDEAEFHRVGSALYGQLESHGVGTIQTRWVRKDGQSIDLLLGAVYLTPGKSRRHITLSVLDISPRVQFERWLRRYEAIISTVSDPMSFIDRDYIFRTVNPACARYYGLLSSDITDVYAGDALGDEYFSHSLKPFLDRCFEGREVHHTECVKISGDENRCISLTYYPYYETNGAVSGAVINGRDITDIELARVQLKQALAGLSQVFDAAAPLCLVDRNMIIRRVNHSFCRRFRMTADEVTGRPCRDVFARLSSDPDMDDMRKLLPSAASTSVTGEATATQHEFSFILKDGSLRHYLVAAVPFAGPDIDGDGLLLNFMDVTRLKAAEAENTTLERQLRHSQKLEALGTLAGGVAHDFNNILFPIIGYTEILKENESITGKARDQLNQIFHAAQRARSLIQQIRSFSRRKVAELSPLEPVPVIKEALKLLRSAIPVTIEIQPYFEPNIGLILMDPTELHQVIMNLCTNAFHSMEKDGGALRVTVRPCRFSAGETGTGVELTIADTGAGIEKELLERVFEPYFTTKAGEKGTGLGLSVVHGIITGCGGRIEIDSTLGVGTCIRIRLPACASKTHDCKPAPAATLPCEGTESILVVDDEPSILLMVEQGLGRLGYRITPLDSSRKALDIIRQNPDAFDLVVTDLTMPDMTGERLAKEMSSIRPDIPVIMMTGYAGSISSSLLPEIRMVLQKPVMINDLACHIRRILDAPAG